MQLNIGHLSDLCWQAAGTKAAPHLTPIRHRWPHNSIKEAANYREGLVAVQRLVFGIRMDCGREEEQGADSQLHRLYSMEDNHEASRNCEI